MHSLDFLVSILEQNCCNKKCILAFLLATSDLFWEYSKDNIYRARGMLTLLTLTHNKSPRNNLYLDPSTFQCYTRNRWKSFSLSTCIFPRSSWYDDVTPEINSGYQHQNEPKQKYLPLKCNNISSTYEQFRDKHWLFDCRMK